MYIYIFLCLYICVFCFKSVSGHFFSVINLEKVNSQYIFRACLEGSFCAFVGFYCLFLFFFFSFFSNTFLFPEKTSTVTSWSTADIKIDF